MAILGKRVRELRTAKKLSQSALAKAIGVTQPTIVAIEKSDGQGGGQETFRKLPELAAALGVWPGDIDPNYAELPPPKLSSAPPPPLDVVALTSAIEALEEWLTRNGRGFVDPADKAQAVLYLYQFAIEDGSGALGQREVDRVLMVWDRGRQSWSNARRKR